MSEVDYDALSGEQLDEMVLDSKASEASYINNQGKEAQVTYLKKTAPDANERRDNVAGCLAICQALQDKFWEACRDLEAQLGGNEDTIELTTVCLADYDPDSLIESWDAQNQEDE